MSNLAHSWQPEGKSYGPTLQGGFQWSSYMFNTSGKRNFSYMVVLIKVLNQVSTNTMSTPSHSWQPEGKSYEPTFQGGFQRLFNCSGEKNPSYKVIRLVLIL